MNKKNPLVSVVIPSYNHEKYIIEAIQSVLDQTFQDFEIIITDDASTDSSVEKIESLSDTRIRLYKFTQNQCGGAAVNNCLKHARGKYIALLNSDDTWVKNKLQKQIEIMESNPHLGAVFTHAVMKNEKMQDLKFSKFLNTDVFVQSNKTASEWLNYFFFRCNALCNPSVLIKNECYKKIGLYDTRLRQLSDFEMWIRLCKKYEIHIINEPLVYFRIIHLKNASSPTIKNITRDRNELYFILKNFFNEISISHFKEIFSEHIINKNFTTEEEYLCEQAFLYLCHPSYKMLGVEMLYNLLGNEKTCHVLQEKYNFGNIEFINITANTSFPVLIWKKKYFFNCILLL